MSSNGAAQAQSSSVRRASSRHSGARHFTIAWSLLRHASPELPVSGRRSGNYLSTALRAPGPAIAVDDLTAISFVRLWWRWGLTRGS